MLDARLLISLTERDKDRLQKLAETNTSGNLAAMVRSLINRAYMMPTEFGLLPYVQQPELESEPIKESA